MFCSDKTTKPANIVPQNNISGPDFAVLILAVQSPYPEYCHIKQTGSYKRQNQVKGEQNQHVLNSTLFPMRQTKAGFEPWNASKMNLT